MGEPQLSLPPVVAAAIYAPPQIVIAPTARAKAVRRKPRRDPAPVARITPEERALIQFAARNPEQFRDSFNELEKHASEPNEIVALRIEPLESNP